ncbi:DUF3817 domain-containing protein [Microbacterium sp. NPDC077663]|uniref:DUF3817 domain-containing protein n=1 Tax=Microbacterium sp. NPDC077663 TaxID=3364189 RepID=UPI0037C5689F
MSANASHAPAGLDRFVRVVFRTAAIVEAVSWIGMITALIIKYPLAGTPLGVTIWGWVHGIAWIVFVVSCLLAAITFRWKWWIAVLGLAMSVLPFLTVPFDLWMERTGRLQRRGSQ